MISPPVCLHFNSDCSKETLYKYCAVHLIYMGQINENMRYEATEERIVYHFIMKYLHVVFIHSTALRMYLHAL